MTYVVDGGEVSAGPGDVVVMTARRRSRHRSRTEATGINSSRLAAMPNAPKMPRPRCFEEPGRAAAWPARLRWPGRSGLAGTP